MFKLVDTLTAWWPVKVFEPDSEKPGTFAAYSFEVEFEILDDDAVKLQRDARAEVFAKLEGDATEKRLTALQEELAALDRQYFLRVIRNWRGVVDGAEKPVVFSEQMLIQALKRQHVREGIAAAYAEAIDTGKARLGN